MDGFGEALRVERLPKIASASCAAAPIVVLLHSRKISIPARIKLVKCADTCGPGQAHVIKLYCECRRILNAD